MTFSGQMYTLKLHAYNARSNEDVFSVFTETGATQTKKKQSDGRTKTIDSNIFKSSQSMSYFQIRPIKQMVHVQNNKISTCLLRCSRLRCLQ